MSNFSNLEYELIEEDRNLDARYSPANVLSPRSSSTSSSPSSSSSSPYNESLNTSLNQSMINTSQSSSSNNDINTFFSCVIDRNRIIKHSQSYSSKQQQLKQSMNSSTNSITVNPNNGSNLSTSFHLANQPTAIVSNVNLFYELIQAMPELSKLQIRYYIKKVYFLKSFKIK